MQGPRPLNPMPMPENRPKKVMSYLDMNEEHYQEISKLKQAVVVQCSLNLNFEISIDKIAEMAEETNLVTQKDISVAKIGDRKFLIFLPLEVAPETFILATPPTLWDDGFLFQMWDQLEGTTKRIPNYKVLIEMHGIPPYLYKESEVIK